MMVLEDSLIRFVFFFFLNHICCIILPLTDHLYAHAPINANIWYTYVVIVVVC